MRRQERLESTPPLRSMLFEEGGEEEGGGQASDRSVHSFPLWELTSYGVPRHVEGLDFRCKRCEHRTPRNHASQALTKLPPFAPLDRAREGEVWAVGKCKSIEATFVN